jgi:hypothetical protein
VVPARGLAHSQQETLGSPLIKVVVPRTLASTQRYTGQPKDEKDHSQDPEKVDGEPKPSEQQH